MSNELKLDEISKKLTLLAALQLIPDVKELSKTDKVSLLNKVGLSSEDIATILGTTKGTVDVLKSRMKKKG